MTGMTDKQLDDIKVRRFWGSAVKPEQLNIEAVLEDFDALVNEVDRLRALQTRIAVEVKKMRRLAAELGIVDPRL